jgi:hypothetical protein
MSLGSIPKWAIIAILTAVYLIAGKLGLMLAFVHASATAVWPPAGITLAALLVFGYRVWPGVFAGAFLTNDTTAGSVAPSIGIAAGNTQEGQVGAVGPGTAIGPDHHGLADATLLNGRRTFSDSPSWPQWSARW